MIANFCKIRWAYNPRIYMNTYKYHTLDVEFIECGDVDDRSTVFITVGNAAERIGYITIVQSQIIWEQYCFKL